MSDALSEPWPQNAPGPYAVTKRCIDCGNCRRHAPECFARCGAGIHSYVRRQPATPDEEARCARARASCPVGAIVVADPPK